ncbi:MAG: asparagine synthase (glutamine-hydrolyzing) [Acidobacteria bacterium]|nr:asparagine synthase (glutamine-hydrolyzing) [Acidobacteriota bacterium]
MCGVAGFTGRCDQRLLEQFAQALRHRGPDDRGVLCDGRIGLSSNRLAIIDLATGRQPLFNEDGSCAIVFNGEIYNFRELRADLQSRHRFQSQGDTEVILHLYEEKGTDVSRHLRGDFAFCIWDANNQTCLLSRDPLGVKPLFYAITGSGNLVFCSELAPLLQHPEISAELDPEAVLEYLTCLCISAPRSLIKGIRKLHPGESLLWKQGAVQTWRYWQIPAVEETHGPAGEFRAQTLALLRTAVHRRLIADVGIGAFLSGGVDSSLIVALASEQYRDLKTFSVGYEESDFDELKFARKVSRRYRTDHHEFVLRPDSRLLLEEVIAAMDEPIADSSAVPTFLVARETCRFVKVVLSGVGGDELFSGYPRHLGAKSSERLPAALAAPISAASRLLSSRPSGQDLGGRLRRFGQGIDAEPSQQYWLWTTFLDPSTRNALCAWSPGSDNAFEGEYRRLFEQAPGSYLDKILRVDLTRYLASDLLKIGDTMTMANSLELRVPFCDADLVSHVARTPSAVRFPGYRLKPILKEIALDFLPREIVQRKKQGFMVPIGNWFRRELKPYLEGELTRRKPPPCLNSDTIARLVHEHTSGRRNHTHLLWAILVLTRWLALHPQVEIEPALCSR